MNGEIRQILLILFICAQIVVLTKQHTPSKNIKTGNKIIKNTENTLEPGRFSQLQGYGTVEDVEPQPKIRIYVYNPPNSFNPTNEMFSERTLREMENERFKEQSNKAENEFESIKESQKRQLARIMDAVERYSNEI
ncbi:hypothetical protein TpMuguga_03g00780 [Theileria parva strain Muguga]|uniref:uncharacterized protein n=1 Tax=Theileria parva strain Muguga TaxID=333668 RepID=UPI001C61E57B|nr:uncharacterized protein TpMuguga_03g00780 [Theileria parva strain Muguga]EAN30621.2 hypothetical protein TpMuguga_03g00780 [Theileria parva strain Muguga]